MIFVPTTHPEWVQSLGGSGDEWVNEMHLLVDGSTIVVGAFEGDATFGTGQTNETVLSSAGDHDFFWARYDSEGELQWARRGGGSGYDTARAVSVHQNGDVLLSGTFEGTVVFGAGQANETTLNSEGGQDIFLARFDQQGGLKWVSQVGGSNNVWGNSVVFWGDSIAMVGGFWEDAVFDPNGPKETTLTSLGIRDGFVAIYDGDGNLEHALQYGDTGNDVATSAAEAADGSLVVTGWFGETVDMFLSQADPISLESNGGSDVFVLKLDPSLEVTWAWSAGSVENDVPNHVEAASDGSLVVSGRFKETIVFGEGQPNETTLESEGSTDVFVLKLDSAGELVWATQAGGAQGDWCSSVTMAEDGRVYAVGSYGYTDSTASGSITFGAGEPNETTLHSISGYGEMYIVAFDSMGAVRWARQGASAAGSRADSVRAAADGTVWAAGFFEGDTVFSPSEPHETQATWAGGEDGFLAKYQP